MQKVQDIMLVPVQEKCRVAGGLLRDKHHDCLVQEGAGGTGTPQRKTKNQLSQLRKGIRLRLNH